MQKQRPGVEWFLTSTLRFVHTEEERLEQSERHQSGRTFRRMTKRETLI